MSFMDKSASCHQYFHISTIHFKMHFCKLVVKKAEYIVTLESLMQLCIAELCCCFKTYSIVPVNDQLSRFIWDHLAF